MTDTELRTETRQRADLSQAAAQAGDSMTAAAWTLLSRVTGLLRFAAVGAVLGPTFFGNTYQFTNSLPNLVYYGFLAGSMFSSVLVPALVRHIDNGDRRASERVAGGFLGVSLVALLPLIPVTIFLGPLALKVAALGGEHAISAAQVHVARVLLVMFIPQMFCYGVIGTSTAVMNSRRRFALAAGAPAVENLGTIVVLVAAAMRYGTSQSLGTAPTGELLLLGLGSTGAVAVHAATQWWGARRAGVVLLPRAGWRDPEVRTIMRRAYPALGQAALTAVQLLVLLSVANRVPGGVVALQIALNFYEVANNVGTVPVALSLLPRLARMHLDDDETTFRDTLVRGLALGFFETIPAAAGIAILAGPLARAVSFGRMDSAAGVTMITAALIPLSLGVLAQTVFQIMTFACYARKDARSPLRSVALQAVVLLGLVSLVPRVHGAAVVFVLAGALSVSATVAACHLTVRTWRRLGRRGSERLIPSLARFAVGAVIMAGPAWLVATALAGRLGPPLGPRVAVLIGAMVGAGVYLAVEALWRTPEVGWLVGGLAHMRGKAGGEFEEQAQVGQLAEVGRGWPRRVPPSFPVGYWDRRLLYPVSSRWLIGPTILAGAGIVAACALKPLEALAGLLILAVMACVCRWPPLAAYLAIGLTPLTVALSVSLPLIRPNEAIDLLLGSALIARGITLMRSGQLPHFRVNRVELAMILMAVTNSVTPLLWMALRQEPISQDDLLYALVMWKLLGLYALIRSSIGTDRQILRCLWISVAIACVVAVVAIMQSLDLAGMPGLLAKFFSGQSAQPTSGPAGGRATSLLGNTFATADLMILNLAVISGLWVCYRRHRLILAAAAALMVFGVISAGEFSTAIGLVAAVVCIAIVSGSPRLLGLFVAAMAVGAIILWPVISTRLGDFQSASGLPVSWTYRLYNLRTYFWPTLFSDWNWVLGVRPSARVPVPSQLGGYVWIESGYTWLLWGGGIPLLASYAFFTVATARESWRAARTCRDARRVAGIAVFTMVIVLVVLMILGTDLTYRGSGDDFFFLIALAVSRNRSIAPAWAGRRRSPHIRGVMTEVIT
jgi:murein biosynthesis integral membrane protein MurJ